MAALSVSRRAFQTLPVVAAIFTVGMSGTVTNAAVPVPDDSGDIVIVKAGDPSKELAHGDGSTAFVVRLPIGAVCPGDSLHDQWRIQSFMVPANTDIGTLAYGVIGPEGPHQLALFGADEAAGSFTNILTPANSFAGQPGRIDTPPPFNLAIAAGEKVPSGSYRIGIACTYFGMTALYWDAEIHVDAASDGEPQQLTWELAGVAPAPADQDENGPNPAFALAGVGVITALGFVVKRNVLSRSSNRSEEPK